MSFRSINGLLRWYHTVRPLKTAQWWFRLARPVALRLSRRRNATGGDIAAAMNWGKIPLQRLQVEPHYFPAKRQFCFLNRCQAFPDSIDWDWRGEGLLWTYNLNYFEWLYDDTLSVRERQETIVAFVAAKTPQVVAGAVYPASLRIMSWIRFLLRYGDGNEAIMKRLFRDADWVCRFPEYHLDGNHLWENAMAILCAGIYFRNDRFHKKGNRMLRQYIRQQVLSDGGHVEGSPMYHSLLLWRLLQCLELLRALRAPNDELAVIVADTSSKMLGWMQAMTFNDGSWPAFNDTAPGIAPSTGALTIYAAALQIRAQEVKLGASGYRMIRFGDFELAIDAGGIQPPFQPGHAHADTGNFCLHYKGRAVVVDTGISTYEPIERRMLERGTNAHNTVAVGSASSSEIWKSFRVGRRVRIKQLQEGPDFVTIAYAPFKYRKVIHERSFCWREGQISVSDNITNWPSGSVASVHFPSDFAILPQGNDKIIAAGLIFHVEGDAEIRLEECLIAHGFNRLAAAHVLRISFDSNIRIQVSTMTGG